MYTWHVFIFCGAFAVVCSQTKISVSPDAGSEKLSFKTPELDDEEGNSPWIPDNLRCDACKAVAFQVWFHFDKYNANHKYRKYNLKEWEILDIMEDLCGNSEIFNNYGIKEINGVHHLSGVGLETNDAPGVIAGGGKWPSRLQDMCEQFMGNVGEDNIYGVYKKQPNDRTRLENYLCHGPVSTARGVCSKNYSKTQDSPKEDTTNLDDEL